MDAGPDLPNPDSASKPDGDAAEPLPDSIPEAEGGVDSSASRKPPSNAESQPPDASDTVPTLVNMGVGIDGAPLVEKDAETPSLPGKLKTLLIGKPHDLEDKTIFKNISLVAFLAWVGLGADGLSSTSYGPAEAFAVLGEEHRFLAIFLALAMGVTVFIIAACYSHIIEAFPSGGGGYLVASKLLGRRLGAVAGSALLVGYVLTIAVSIAAAGDAMFGLMGHFDSEWKLIAEAAVIVILIVLNLRGVKESILVLLPIFVLFLITHFALIVGALSLHIFETGTLFGNVVHEVSASYNDPEIGLLGMFSMLMMAYSLGAATYTGIEAVSNSTQVMREPRVATAQRTMRYMAWSLALAAGGLIVAYLLLDIHHSESETLNLGLTRKFMEELGLTGGWLSNTFTWATMLSEGALLVVAAQVGYIGGPRLLASMAQDSWMPRWFSNLSERLATQNGILLMGVAALAALLSTGGDLFTLVVIYVINVFVTFTLSMFGMCRHWFSLRGIHPLWRRRLALFVLGAVLCSVILTMTIYQKFFIGGWRTLLVTGVCVGFCFVIHRYYYRVGKSLRKLNEMLGQVQVSATGQPNTAEPDPAEPAAVILVGDYSGLGIHTMLNAVRFAPDHFKSFIFISVGVIDTGNFKGSSAVDSLREHCEDALRKYVDLGQRLGMASTSFMAIDTDAVDGLEECCLEVARRFPKATFFAGQLVFQKDTWLHRLLHNQTAISLQRRLQWAGVPMVILPTRVR
ncbi:MAG: APC family permease [Pirellulaceae bacterium]|nr:APC family permease [Pirellulaceae bacterium]